jgi:hypothetical protein
MFFQRNRFGWKRASDLKLKMEKEIESFKKSLNIALDQYFHYNTDLGVMESKHNIDDFTDIVYGEVVRGQIVSFYSPDNTDKKVRVSTNLKTLPDGSISGGCRIEFANTEYDVDPKYNPYTISALDASSIYESIKRDPYSENTSKLLHSYFKKNTSIIEEFEPNKIGYVNPNSRNDILNSDGTPVNSMSDLMVKPKAPKVTTPKPIITPAIEEPVFTPPVIEEPVFTPPPRVRQPRVRQPKPLITPVIEQPIFTPPPMVKQPRVRQPKPVIEEQVFNPPVIKTLEPVYTAIQQKAADAFSFLAAELNLGSLHPNDIYLVMSEIKPITDKLPGRAPSVTKTITPLIVKKVIQVFADLHNYYDFSDLSPKSVNEVLMALKPLMDKLPALMLKPVAPKKVKTDILAEKAIHTFEYLNADLELGSLKPTEIYELTSQIKPLTDKMIGTPLKPLASLTPSLVNKIIMALKNLDKIYDLGDLTITEANEVLGILKPLMDKVPNLSFKKKAFWF